MIEVRGYRIDREADLRGARLAGLDLRGQSLAGCRLDGADMSDCRLDGANFAAEVLPDGRVVRPASLVGADLRGATFRGTNLEGVDASRAWFSPNTDLSTAFLSFASFRGAYMRAVRITGPDPAIVGADFGGTHLEHADFSSRDIGSTSFRGARAKRARWTAGHVGGCDFRGAFLVRADFSQTSIGGAKFGRAAVEGARFTSRPHGIDSEGIEPDRAPSAGSAQETSGPRVVRAEL